RLKHEEIPDDYGVVGRVFQTRQAEISHFEETLHPETNRFEQRTGVVVNTMITVPLQIAEMAPIGVVQLINKEGGSFNEVDIAVLDTISDVSTLAYLNQKLLERNRQVASLEGMGRAAHDMANKAGVLVTMLPQFENSLNGLRETLAKEGVKGEACLYLDMMESVFRDFFAPYSNRVFRYSKLVNDLAAGKELTAEKSCQSFAKTIKEAVSFMEARARQANLKLIADVEDGAPDTEFDELYVIRIAENLIENAIKAASELVPDGYGCDAEDPDEIEPHSQITVRYTFRDNLHCLEVLDDGPGMSRQIVKQILQGEASSRWGRSGGTGFGTKAVRELAAAHGARLSVDSEPGKGTRFCVEFPHEAGLPKDERMAVG
ncbi:MAG: ATP-binding protein, partial [Fimbriimonadaceae bacterium]